MKTLFTTSFFSIFLFLAIPVTQAQDRPDQGSVGLTASLQGGQTSISIPIWASDDLVIAPSIGLVHEQDSFTTLNLGVKPRFYQTLGDNFASYLGLTGMIQYTSPEFGDEITNLLFGANGGGEYFLDSHFSVGVEGQLNFLVRDNDNNRVSTGAAITGSYYF